MYNEYLESLADLFPAIVPFIALAGLIAARTAGFRPMRMLGESVFYGTLVTVALGTGRSMMNSEPTWLLHTASLGFMIIGAAVFAIGSQQEVLAD